MTKMRIKAAFKLVLCLTFICSVQAYALSPGDTVLVNFKDGTSVAGSLVMLSTNYVEINVGGTELSWNMDTVNQVTAASTPIVQQAQPQPPVQSLNPFDPTLVPQPTIIQTDPLIVGVPVAVVHRHKFSKEEQKKFLDAQAKEREERKHIATTPESDLQFNLQQALDRQARGLPFTIPTGH